MSKPIILLDLNFTLVSDSELKDTQKGSFAQKIALENYRQWLVDLIRPYTVLLCTVRPIRHQAQTLARIAALTGWQPQEAYFNSTGNWRGYIVKAAYLEQHIFPKHGTPDAQPYYAIESSVYTKRMYIERGIPAKSILQGEVWTALPFL